MDIEIFKENCVIARRGRLRGTIENLPEGKTLAVSATKIDYVRQSVTVLNSKAKAVGVNSNKLITSLSVDGKAILVHRLRGDAPEREVRIMLRATEVGEVFDNGK